MQCPDINLPFEDLRHAARTAPYNIPTYQVKMGSLGTDTINYTESMGDMDIIFAGGGTAACIAAGRLAKANPELKILLIEGGPNQFEVCPNPSLLLLLTDIEPCCSKSCSLSQSSCSRYEDRHLLQVQSIRSPQWP